jgi:KDO2-lipid IV(A) lauroyltransferase
MRVFKPLLSGLSTVFSRLVLGLVRALGRLPLPVVRGVGVLMGGVLFVLAFPRRRVVLVNLRLCFPQWSRARRWAVALQTFVYFSQSWLDRGWLWEAPAEVLEQRLRRVGNWQALDQPGPVIIFSPHFYGLDAAALAVSLRTARQCTTIYTPQRNLLVDAWAARGRQRFGDVHLMTRFDGVKSIISLLRKDGLLFLLPDMNFGPEESIFVPFFGIPTATVPSLSRFARMGRARVVPLLARLTPQGYDMEMLEPWADFPSDDVAGDTALMNARLQSWIANMPAQYFWVHKRFKTRPQGDAAFY